MNPSELPIGFTFALSMNEQAMKNFSALCDLEKNNIAMRAKSVHSKQEMDHFICLIAQRNFF